VTTRNDHNLRLGTVITILPMTAAGVMAGTVGPLDKWERVGIRARGGTLLGDRTASSLPHMRLSLIAVFVSSWLPHDLAACRKARRVGRLLCYTYRVTRAPFLI
jgi:hypothetical protein